MLSLVFFLLCMFSFVRCPHLFPQIRHLHDVDCHWSTANTKLQKTVGGTWKVEGEVEMNIAKSLAMGLDHLMHIHIHLFYSFQNCALLFSRFTTRPSECIWPSPFQYQEFIGWLSCKYIMYCDVVCIGGIMNIRYKRIFIRQFCRMQRSLHWGSCAIFSCTS